MRLKTGESHLSSHANFQRDITTMCGRYGWNHGQGFVLTYTPFWYFQTTRNSQSAMIVRGSQRVLHEQDSLNIKKFTDEQLCDFSSSNSIRSG